MLLSFSPQSRIRRALTWVPSLFVAALVVGLTVRAAPLDQRLANLSTRGQVGTGASIMITGFVVQQGAPKQVLIRAVGPRLATAPFSLTGTLANPKLDLYNAQGVLIASNDNWLSADAASMTSVGAFSLTTGSLDSAMVATLAPGAYTAQVTGVNNTTGLALLEVYDVTGSARLMNLSTRAVVGSGANMLISGLVVAPSGGIRKVLIRAIGPGLATLNVGGGMADPIFSVLNSNNQVIASNDNWTTANTGGELTAAFTQVGAFPLLANSKDAALIVDLPPNTGNTSYTIQVSSADGGTGLGLVEVYDLTPDSTSLITVSVAASVPTTDTTGSAPGVFTFSRLGPTTSAVTVAYAVSGTAVSGVDYQPLSGSVTIPAGSSTATVTLVPIANAANSNTRTATLDIISGANYSPGTSDNATVTIFYSTGSLYVANLRTTGAGNASTAYGTATLQLSPDQKSAFINVSFSNLSSPEVVAHLEIDGNYVYNLPQGQVTGAYWTFTPTGTYSQADLVAALMSGRLSVEVDTASNPAGELDGGFLKSSGALAFSVPVAPPALDLTHPTQQDAARFLTQATFGATAADITTLLARGYTGWINDQMALPASLHRTATMADFTAYTASATVTLPTGADRQAAWWKLAVTAPDQLRQRVAFALSEIMVISDQNSTVNTWQEGAANYYDVLVNGAFGNFRTLLENVTLNPMMGVYLSTLRNSKAVGTTMPDENFAREVMQLFTVGLNELQPDGTLRLDPTGQPIPTYTQDTVVETSKVFTGWAFASTAATPNFRSGTADYINPMLLYPAFHEDAQKTVVGGKIIAANQGGIADLKAMLDILFNHENTAPFVSRQLIQRLVTSNPSPGYVYRVAQVFANNGAGVRGDLSAVVRAILTDYEARSPALLTTPGTGKLKEPLVRSTALLRAFGGASNSGRFNISNPETSLAQAALRANTVFNFFEPDFVLPGAIAAAGLYAPEFEILTDTTAITIPNFLYTYLNNTRSTSDQTQQTIALDFTSVLTLAKTPQPLVDSLNLTLSSGTLSKTTTDRIVSALTALPASTADLDRIRTAVYLVITSPEGAIQK